MTGRDCLTLSLHTAAQRKDHVRTQQEGGQGERAVTRSEAC